MYLKIPDDKISLLKNVVQDELDYIISGSGTPEDWEDYFEVGLLLFEAMGKQEVADGYREAWEKRIGKKV